MEPHKAPILNHLSSYTLTFLFLNPIIYFYFVLN